MRHGSLVVFVASVASILLTSIQAHAFEIRGRVVDSATQAGILGVVVSFFTLDGKPIDQTVTSSGGEFKKDVAEIQKQFRIAYAKTDGGSDGLGYEGYGRTFPVDNNVKNKDVDTVALRARRKVAADMPGVEKAAIIRDWVSHYLVTKEPRGVSTAIRFYKIDDAIFNQGVRQLELETGLQPTNLNRQQFLKQGMLIKPRAPLQIRPIT